MEQYGERFGRVLRHIEAHLSEELTVAGLSAVAAFSPAHFHRQFSAFLGISVWRYVQMRRLKRAAWRLAYRTGPSVLEIALDSGYAGPEAFCRAFRQCFGRSPAAFRRAPDWSLWQQTDALLLIAGGKTMTETPNADAVEIVTTPDIPVAILTHRGDPAEIGGSIRRFIAWRKATGTVPPASRTYNIFYDDPRVTPPEAFRMGLCAATTRPVAPNDQGVEAGVIPGGRCARVRHTGPDAGLEAVITYLYARWLPDSGEALRDFPVYGQRVRFFPDVPEHEAVIDVYLPLADRAADGV